MLNWSNKCFLVVGTATNQEPRFTTKCKMQDTKLYAPVVALSTQDNLKLSNELESYFKRTISSNKDQSKITTLVQKLVFRFFN